MGNGANTNRTDAFSCECFEKNQRKPHQKLRCKEKS